MFAKENAPAMKAAKAQSNEVYSKYQKMAKGGEVETMEQQASKMAQGESGVLRKLREQYPNDQVHDLLYRFPKGYKLPKGVDEALKGLGSVTETEKSVTVSPAGKKRGGRAC
jgi:predicted lipase